MKQSRRHLAVNTLVGLVFAAVVITGVAFALLCVRSATHAQGSGQRISMVSDWSHHHVVFSAPTNIELAGKLQREPRYWLQMLSRNARRGQNGWPEQEVGALRVTGLDRAFSRDWGQSLGAGGSVGVPLSGVNWWPVYPAKYSFNINTPPDCTNDFVVFPTNLAGATGASGQASIIAFNKLYAGTPSTSAYCGVANPSVYWSYNTNFDASGAVTTGTVQTSPVLSADGSMLAFVENRPAVNGAILHLLKWHAGDGGAINTPADPTIAHNWTADGATGDCPTTGACMISIVLNGPESDTASSPFYDYARDALYVGDDNGVLHKIINAFGMAGATPSEVVTDHWPISVDAGTMLTSPTLDSISGNIFTGDSSGRLSYVREAFSATGTCATGSIPCLGSTSFNFATAHVIADAPIVDSTTGKVFVFFGNTGTSSAVVQSDITVSASVTATLGSGTAHHIHSGAFDNTYLTGNGSSGRLYMCGSSATSIPTIQRIGFTNSGRVPASPFANPIGTMNAAVDTAILAVDTHSAECSPVTELYNANAPAASRDQIFFGVEQFGSGSNCGSGSSGCVMSINVTSTPATLTIANSIAEINGPSGIIVDNDANTTTYPQASSLYFSSQGNSTGALRCGTTTGVGCAVKVTQAALQ